MAKRSSSSKQNQRRANVARRSMVARGLPVEGAVESKGGRRSGLHLPRLQSTYAAIIADSADLVTVANAWEAERCVAGVWTGLHLGGRPGEAFELVLQDLIAEVARAGGLGPYVLLRGLAAVGPPDGQEKAHAAAELMAARQPSWLTDAPDWIERLGSVTVGDCYRYTDPYGEMVDLVCEFHHADGDRRHAFVITIEQAAFGLASEIQLLVVSSDIDARLTGLAVDVRRQGGRFESITPSEAARTLRTALIMDNTKEPHPAVDVPTLGAFSEGVLPLLVQRMRVMDDGAVALRNTVPVLEEWPAERRSAFVDEFLRARSPGLHRIEQSGQLAARLVDFTIKLGCPPDRTGPVIVERLMLDILPRSLTLPDLMIDDMVLVAKEWLAWRLDNLEAPMRARADLRTLNDKVIGLLPKQFRNHLVNPAYPYAADVSRGQATGDGLQPVLERRTFAVAYSPWRGDHEVEFQGRPGVLTHVADLDAADPEQRRLITQVWLEDEEVNDPSLIASRCAVIDQLWDDAPEQVWITAQRLSGAGMSRLQVIDRLAEVWRRNLTTVPDDPRIDYPATGLRLDQYLRELISMTPTSQR